MTPTSSQKMRSRKPMVIPICVFAVLASGVLFLSWRDMTSDVPKFEQLQAARANGFRAHIAREVWGPHEFSIDFFDDSGLRYQVRGVEQTALDQIATALPTEIPVLIRYGRWRSAFPSTKIFTVYQLEIGPQVIFPYSRLATASQREKSAAPWIILFTIGVAGMAVFAGVWKQRKFQRRLNKDATRPR